MAKRKPTTKVQRKNILKELNLTEEEINTIWNNCVEVNSKCKLLSKCGKDWTDLGEYQIRQLPTLVEETLRKKAEQEKLEIEKKEREKKEEEEKQYYYDHFEEIMVNKIDNNEELTEKELETLAFYHAESTSYEENRRWSRIAHSVIKLMNRYFMLEWEEGLTECQENGFYNQPYEVEKHEYEKTIIVTEWIKKSK